jgi:hypothetical protein
MTKNYYPRMARSSRIIFLARRSLHQDFPFVKISGIRGQRLFHDQRAVALLGSAVRHSRRYSTICSCIWSQRELQRRAPASCLTQPRNPRKPQNARRMAELDAQFVAQAREEKQFEAVGRFARDMREVGLKGRAGAHGALFVNSVSPKPCRAFSSAWANSPTVTVSRSSSILK